MYIPTREDPLSKEELAAELEKRGVTALDVLHEIQGKSTGMWDDPIEPWMLLEQADIVAARKEAPCPAS
jgi:hypothetical protein